MDKQEEAVLFKKIKKGDEKAFEKLFHCYYSHLCLFAEHYVRNRAEAEEIVQDTFVSIWEKKEKISITTSVKNSCLNYIKHTQIKNQHAEKILSEANGDEQDDARLIEPELLPIIEECINSLPEKRREVFRLSREEGLKYREIAKKLNISVKTVETHMGLAIKTLRDKLKQFTSLILLNF